MQHPGADARKLWRFTWSAAALAILAALPPGCLGGQDVAPDEEAIINGTNDFVRVAGPGSDYAPDNIENWSRNATVLVIPESVSGPDFSGEPCSGVLVSPRVVLTAAHCVRSIHADRFLIGVGPRGFPSLPGFPGALPVRSDGAPIPFGVPFEQAHAFHCHADYDNTFGIHCGDGGTLPQPTSPAESRFDLAVLILDQRIDRHAHDDFFMLHAIPAVPTRAVPPLAAVTHAGYGRVGRCPFVGIPNDVPTLRQVTPQTLLCAGAAAGSDRCFPNLLTLTFYGGLPGDSGGPVYQGSIPRPSAGGNALIAVGIFSFFSAASLSCGEDAFDVAVSLGDSQVVHFLETYLGPGYVGTTIDGVWTGPDDVPRANDPGRQPSDWTIDPDGDGLVGAHDICWGVRDPTQASLTTTCQRNVWTPPTSPEECATEMHQETRTIGCIAPGTTPLCGFVPAGELSGDEDGDGIPNACDLCPCSSLPDGGDCDGDGIGDNCDDDFRSSCAGAIRILRPTVRLDSNIDAEVVFGRPACVAHTDVTSCNADSAHSCAWVSTGGHFACLSNLRDECDTNPVVNIEPFATTLPASPVLPARGIFSGGLSGWAVIGTPSSLSPERTFNVGMRWCPCASITAGSLEERQACGRPSAGGSAACPVNNGTEFDRAIEGGAPWQGMLHHPTIPAPPSVFNPVTDLLQIGHHIPNLAAPRDFVTTWDFTTDPLATPLLVTNRGALGQTVSVRLAAEVWTHDATPVCHGASCPPSYGRSLASHYTAENFEWVPTSQPPEAPPMRQEPIVWPVPQAVCTVCAASFPSPYVVVDPCFALGTCADPAWNVRLGGVEIQAVDALGHSLLSATASARLLQPGLRFIAPSEPIGALLPGALRVVGVDAQLQPRVALVASGGQMLELAEVLKQLPTQGDPPGLALLGNLHEIIRVGGDLPSTITFMNLDTSETWDTVMMTGDLPIDIAAVSAAVDGSELLVVERRHEDPPPRCDARDHSDHGECEREGRRSCVEHGHVRDRMQLVLGSLGDRRFTRLSSARRSGQWDAWWVVALADSSYALVASSSSRDVHAIARLVLTPQRRGSGLDLELGPIARGAGAVIATPVGSLRGVTVPVHERASWRSVGYAIEDLARRDRRTHDAIEDLF